MKPRRIVLFVILPALLIYLGMKLYVQYKPVKVFVSRPSQMPVELASGLHMEEHKISPVIKIESLYENSEDKLLSLEEIKKDRTKLAWGMQLPINADSIIIMDTNRVVARRLTRRFMEECELVKENSAWSIKSHKRTEVKTVSGN
jgi:hypothetical protein